MARDAHDPAHAVRSALSALADGEAAGRDTASLTAAWAGDADLRRDWHAWHLIGDALRSDELAGRGDEAAFLARLRTRLDDEPVVIAPASVAATRQAGAGAGGARRLRRRWGGGLAVAAGFAAVAAVLVAVNAPTSGTDGAMLAQSPAPLRAGAVPVSTTAAGPLVAPAAATPLGPMLRDARLDAYLSAHRQVGIGSLMGAAGGSVQPTQQAVGTTR